MLLKSREEKLYPIQSRYYWNCIIVLRSIISVLNSAHILQMGETSSIS